MFSSRNPLNFPILALALALALGPGGCGEYPPGLAVTEPTSGSSAADLPTLGEVLTTGPGDGTGWSSGSSKTTGPGDGPNWPTGSSSSATTASTSNHGETTTTSATGDTDSSASSTTSAESRGPLIVFATSEVFYGGMIASEVDDMISDKTGVERADDYCNYFGDMHHEGNYRAWIADATNTPKERFHEDFWSAGPFFRVDGQPVADNWDALEANGPANPINIAEDSSMVRGGSWTNTTAMGDAGGHHCSSWTVSGSGQGAIGNVNATSLEWTEYPVPQDCNNTFHLYCFEQP